jgi:p-cumate 2,3-dioxygenase beta subunit
MEQMITVPTGLRQHHEHKEASTITRQDIEDFLYEEAALLDEWRMDEWLAFFTEDARYVVPSTDAPEADPRNALVFINDDMVRLRGRVERLKSRHAHREYPHSRTRRLITNVRLRNVVGNDIFVTASFLVYRLRKGQSFPYLGRYEYTLSFVGGGLRIRHRKAVLDLESLGPHGAVSIIL